MIATVGAQDGLAAIGAAHARLEAWYDAEPKSSPLPFGDTNWTYDGDKHVAASQPLPVIFMGFNPGSGNGATEPRVGPGERAWRSKCVRMAQLPADRIVFAELISLPTHNVAGLEPSLQRLDRFMAASVEVNRAIIDFHQPQVVFQTGLNRDHLDLVERHYGLRHVASGTRPHKPAQPLWRSYLMDDGTPWIAFRHFAAPGFSGHDYEGVQQHVAALDRSKPDDRAALVG